jgi:integrase
MKGDFTLNELSVPHGNCKWLVAGKLGGQRKRFFLETKEQARNKQTEMNQEVRRHKAGLASISAAHQAQLLPFIPRLEALGVSISEALSDYLRRHDHRAKSVTVSEGWKQYEADCQKRVSDGVLRKRSLESIVNKCDDLAEKFGPEQVCDLSPNRIGKWINSLPIAPVSKESYRNTISGFFSFAVREDWIKEHPMTEGRVAKFKVPPKEVSVLGVDESRQLLATADFQILPVIAIGLFAGLRPEEINKLEWSDILWTKRQVNVRFAVSKTARARYVHMEDNLLEWLAPYRAATGKIFAKGIGAQIRRVSAAAKVAFGEEYVWKKDQVRHTYGSCTYALTRSAPETAFRMGHTTTKMLFQHYNNRRTDEEAKAHFGIRPMGPPAFDNIVAFEQQAA